MKRWVLTLLLVSAGTVPCLAQRPRGSHPYHPAPARRESQPRPRGADSARTSVPAPSPAPARKNAR